MKINITYSQKTRVIKQSFNKMFPYLKIEFFNTPHLPGHTTSGDELVQDNKSLGDINKDLKEGFILIRPEDKVSTIEQTFQQEFGLPIQIFRKQNNVWIETTRTDQLTLAEQNIKGKEATVSSTHIIPGDRYLEDGQY